MGKSSVVLSEEDLALYKAISSGDLEACKSAIANGADLNKERGGSTPLSVAAGTGNVEICRRLMVHGATIPEGGLAAWVLMSSACSYVEVLQFLVKEGGNPHVKASSNATLLHWAASAGKVDVCQFLLKNGLDVHAVDQNGQTPLRWVTTSSSVPVARLLVSHGASPSAAPASPAKTFHTPFQGAVKHGCLDLVKFFVDECGEDPAQRTVSGRTMASLTKEKDVIAYLRSGKTQLAVAKSIPENEESAAQQPKPRRSSGLSPL